jgi:hypothetical protein
MASRVQKRRGTKAEHEAFTTGAAGELTVEVPSTRASAGASIATSAIHVHHGDGATGDRFSSDLELTRQTPLWIDEQAFLAKITGWVAINDDGSSSTNSALGTVSPDAVPNKWYYKWEEVSLGNLATTGVAQVARIQVNGAASVSSEGSNDTIALTIVDSTNTYQSISAVNVNDGDNANHVATDLRTAIAAISSPAADYTLGAVTDDGANSYFDVTCNTKGFRKHPVVTVGSGIGTQTVTVTITTEGDEFVPLANGSTNGNDLKRRSNPAGDTNHTLMAVNLCELRNTKDYLGPGLRIVAQSANSGTGSYPDNYRVMPIGGSNSYNTTTGFPLVTGTGTVQVEQIVEIRERRKLKIATTVGTTDSNTTIFGSDSIYNNVDKFYYFNLPNVVMGPC